jgi:3-phosphoshikimate 1-carboxyvinyltransferase
MKVKINPGPIKGTVTPASKSMMQRACAAALLTNAVVRLKNYGKSNDDKAALHIIQQLGARVDILDEHTLEIKSSFKQEQSSEPLVLHCGESGLGIRMFSPIAALLSTKVEITGAGSLRQRPMGFFDEVFPQLDIEIKSNNGKLPLQLQGPLRPASIEVDGSLSSQFLTGLLMAFATSNRTDSVKIVVNNLKSKPYIDLTLAVMAAFGLDVPAHEEYKVFKFLDTKKKEAPTKPVEYTVGGDWSGASFLLVAGAINGEVHVKGLPFDNLQADQAISSALQLAGAKMHRTADQTIVVSKSDLVGFKFDATDCPDLFPPLVALAAHCKGRTRIKGLSRLKHKESDRGAALVAEFGKLGIAITRDQDQDELIITGAPIQSAIVHSHQDHRIAMACAVAGLTANGSVTLEASEAIDKSYPDFFRHLQGLNANLEYM